MRCKVCGYKAIDTDDMMAHYRRFERDLIDYGK
jgi:hypothetical protein